MRWSVPVAVAILAACALAAPPAFAADPEFCEEYARAAVHQAERARESPYCEHGAHGPRWSLDYRDHYEWCRGVHRRDAEAERDIRHEHLEACRHGYR